MSSRYQGWPEHRLVKAQAFILAIIATLESVQRGTDLAAREGLIEDVYSGAAGLIDEISNWRGELELIEEELECPSESWAIAERKRWIRERIDA